ncbi:hypothetical protein LAZ67_10000956 [Cordylochernes scorpioides]|uniref:Integrase catalytic domain-containing protein n=1 Tax=Cordylochernes scorpioides TaxID=51811 RepID=A0ABY6KY77_9ARAC|nr:hypothetical protein LAZ67_10000956 [Cordylochernes scorpioides]
MFSEGREDVNDEWRAGRPSTSTTDEKINEVEKMILANRRITVREVAEDSNISIGSCHSIFINVLGMRRVAAKFVSKILNCDQKQHRMNIANEMLDSVRDDPNSLQRVITGDEAGVVHHEFLPQGRTVNKEYYLQVMRNLREAIRQKRPDLWKNKNWLLHHDNSPAHTSLLVRDFLAKNNTLMMPQPPYSPDLAPCDFFLFPKLKRPMKGRRYATLDEIKTASKEELKRSWTIDKLLECLDSAVSPHLRILLPFNISDIDIDAIDKLNEPVLNDRLTTMPPDIKSPMALQNNKLDFPVGLHGYRSGSGLAIPYIALTGQSLTCAASPARHVEEGLDFWAGFKTGHFKVIFDKKGCHIYDNDHNLMIRAEKRERLYLVRTAPSRFPESGECSNSIAQTNNFPLVHCDLMGPFDIESWGGSRFVLTIIDDASRYTKVYFLKRKGDTLEKFKEWMKEAENQTGFSLKRIRTDNGLEFCSSPWDIFTKAHGIVHERTMVYTPEQNGVAERMNRTLLNLVRSTVNSCNLPTASWAELTNTVAYLRNRVTNRHNEEKTPFELWFGKRPALQHLRAIGCETFVHVPKQRRNSKLQPRATKGILVGYSLQGRGWRIWIPEKRQVVESRNCVFKEEILYKQPKRERDTLTSVHFSSKEASFQEESNADQPVDRETEELIGTTGGIDQLSETLPENLRSHPMTLRSHGKTAESPEEDNSGGQINATSAEDNNPTYEEAMNSPEVSNWIEAIEEERESLERHNVWQLQELPKVGILSRYCDNYTRKHWEAGKRVLRYLKSTKDFGITYRSTGKPLIAFSDATENVKFYLWRNKSILRQAAISHAENYIDKSKTRHFAVKYHFVREKISEEAIELFYTTSAENPADFLTKPLARSQHENGGDTDDVLEIKIHRKRPRRQRQLEYMDDQNQWSGRRTYDDS